MNIFKTKKGNVGLISNSQFLQSCNGSGKLMGYGKEIKEDNVTTKDIVIMYNIGDLITFVLKYPDELKSMFKKEQERWKLNSVNGNIINEMNPKLRLIKELKYKQEEVRRIKNDLSKM